VLFKKPTHQVPDTPRPLDADEVEFLEKELRQYKRWVVFWTIVAVPAALVGIAAGAGGIYALLFGYPMQNFFMGAVISLIGFAPLYARFSLRDQARAMADILEASPRVDEGGPVAGATDEPAGS
jgi:hypothetical protein